MVSVFALRGRIQGVCSWTQFYLSLPIFIHYESVVPVPESWNGVVTELAALIEEYSNYIDINCIGFPDNWEEQLSRE